MIVVQQAQRRGFVGHLVFDHMTTYHKVTSDRSRAMCDFSSIVETCLAHLNF